MEGETLPSVEVHMKEEPEIKLEIKEERDNDEMAWREKEGAATDTQGNEGAASGEREEEENGGPTGDEDGMLSGLECGLCGRRYSSLASLRGHLSRQHRVGSGYTCELCGAVGGTKAAFKRHLLRTHGPHTLAPHHFLTKCRHCGEGVATLPLLYQHIRHCHEDVLSQYHCCNHCPVLFTTRQGLSRHYKRRHKDETPPPIPPLLCRDCGAELPSPTALRDHRLSLHPTSPSDLSGNPSSVSTGFTCDQCLTVFACRSYLAKHIKKVHQSCPRPQSYRCGECGREYRHKARLQRHITTHHPAPGHRVHYSCPTCAKTFTSYEKRKSHQRRAHRDRSLWQCGECHRGFLSSAELDLHRHARHKGACHVCGKVFLRRDSLREHLLIHNGPRLPCSYCPKTFTQASNLKRHIRIHTGEKPYQCTYCGKPFGDRSACKSHMLVHTGAGRCSCPTCGATFSKRQKLNYHMRLHTGDGLLHCPLCSRPATNTYDLKKHLETHQVALLTALRGSFLYSDVEDLPDLALKALHNLVWVAVQNSQREKVEVEKNDPSDSKEGEVEPTKLRENVSNGMERTDWSCVGVVMKNENQNGSCSGTRESMKLANGWSKKKNGKQKQGMKHESDSDTPGNSLNTKDLVDMKREEKTPYVNKISEMDNESSKKIMDDCHEFDTDNEQTQDYSAENPESQSKKVRRPRKIRHPKKSVQNCFLWERKEDNGESLSGMGLHTLKDSENIVQELTEYKCIKQGSKAKNGGNLNNCSLQNTTEHEKVEQESAELSCVRQENKSRNSEHLSNTGMQYANDTKNLVKDMADENVGRVNKMHTKKLMKGKADNMKRTSQKQTIAPLAVLTQVIQFILGSLSAPPNTIPTAPNTTPTLGDQLVERCLEVIMRDGDDDDDGSENQEESNNSEVIMRDDDDNDGNENQERSNSSEVIMKDDAENHEERTTNEVIMRDGEFDGGDESREGNKESEVFMRNSCNNQEEFAMSKDTNKVMKRNWGDGNDDESQKESIKNSSRSEVILRDGDDYDNENKEESNRSGNRSEVIMRDRDGVGYDQEDSHNIRYKNKAILGEGKSTLHEHQEESHRSGSGVDNGSLEETVSEAEKGEVRAGNLFKNDSDGYKEHVIEIEDGLKENACEIEEEDCMEGIMKDNCRDSGKSNSTKYNVVENTNKLRDVDAKLNQSLTEQNQGESLKHGILKDTSTFAQGQDLEEHKNSKSLDENYIPVHNKQNDVSDIELTDTASKLVRAEELPYLQNIITVANQ